MTITPSGIWKDIDSIRQNSPLVHNITNYVVMNNTANALLALGASPVMAPSYSTPHAYLIVYFYPCLKFHVRISILENK